MGPQSSDAAVHDAARPWQLDMFDFSLKKRQKLALLLELMGPAHDQRCLLITSGDNPGGLNYYLRAAGGSWDWAEMEAEGIGPLQELLRDPVRQAHPDGLPFEAGRFDRVVVVDVHEHLESVDALNREIARVLAPGGTAIVTTPGGRTGLPVARLKRWLGMDDAAYGHTVQGYTWEQLEGMMRDAGLEPMARGAYSRFFTELAELAINFAYVKVLGRRQKTRPAAGAIAPRTSDQLRAVGKSYRMYRVVFPLVRAFAALDALIPGRGGYAVAVTARRPA